MSPRDDFAARHRFGRVARIPTPTPLGVGDIKGYLLLPAGDRPGPVTLIQIPRRLEQQPSTASELAAKLLPRVCEVQGFLVMSEVIGHLDVLAERGMIVIEERDGREIARAA